MKILLIFLCLTFCLSCFSQDIQMNTLLSKSMLKNLLEGDSLCYYQCHVENGTQQLVSVSGQTVIGKLQPYTITEKYLVTKNQQNFVVKYFTSSLTSFPNKKFSGLKMREKEYWKFKQDSTFLLNETGIKVLLSLENKGREAIEYDYPITKYTTNQLIIKHKKDFKQLIIDGPYIISKLIK